MTIETSLVRFVHPVLDDTENTSEPFTPVLLSTLNRSYHVGTSHLSRRQDPTLPPRGVVLWCQFPYGGGTSVVTKQKISFRQRS